MKRLEKERIKDFHIVISQKHFCRCREFNKLLMSGKATEQDLLEIEIFLKIGCSEFYMLIDLYKDQRIHNDNNKRAIDDPTTQE
jgi:hypothetical protein